jgi:hypothetical protein
MIRLWYTLLVGLLWLSAGLLPAGQAPTGKDADILARLRAWTKRLLAVGPLRSS